MMRGRGWFLAYTDLRAHTHTGRYGGGRDAFWRPVGQVFRVCEEEG